MQRRSPFVLAVVFCAAAICARPIEFSKVLIARNIRTGEFHVKNLTEIEEPDRIGRVRLFVTRMKSPNGKGEEFDFYLVRMRWTEPDHWNDNFNAVRRSYDVICELEDDESGQARNLLQLNVSGGFNGYDERFRFPLDSRFRMKCQVRPRNSEDLVTEWTRSKSVNLFELKTLNP